MTKKKSKYDNLTRVIQEFLSGKYYTPMGKKALFKKLGFNEENFELFDKIIQDLLQSNVVETVKNKIQLKGQSKPAEEFSYVEGKISIHPRGFGFVTPNKSEKFQEDIFIPSPFTHDAVSQDIVRVWVNPHSNWKKGAEGEVVAIIQRTKTHLAGIVKEIRAHQAILYAPTLGPDRPIHIPLHGEKSIEIGDRLKIKITQWKAPLEGCVETKIGSIHDASKDVQAAIAEYDIPHDFPEKALKQAKALGKQVKKKELQTREDFTKLTTITIDPKTARDFDDALSVEKISKDCYHLGVHIADVAHYIPVDSPLDEEAKTRSNSVYFPGKCVPMLPESLSNNLCSLKPQVIRLTMSVFMKIDKQGNILDYSIKRGFIKSRKRLTYEDAKDILDGKKKSRFKSLLDMMVELCIILKNKRKSRGSVDLALPELRLNIDEDGNPTGFSIEEYDITHQLVEEFMLKANETVATHLANQGKEAIFRVHSSPSEEDIQDFFSLARVLGFQLSQNPPPEEIQQLFNLAKDTPFAHQLAIRFIKSMKLASYSHENVGHYGLALEYYCHFTSPIRRYTDLIIQRLIFNEQPEEVDIEEIAALCSERERIAFRAESNVSQLKKRRFLHQKLQETPHHVYEALISSIKPNGIYFSLVPLEVEGFLHISKIGKDYYHYLSASQSLKGEKTHQTYIVGQLIHVQLLSLDFISGQLLWKIIKKK